MSSFRRRFGNIYVKEQPYSEIWYETNDGKLITPYISKFGEASILSNTIIDGKGVIKFDKSITLIPQNAFRVQYNLTKISYPNSVLSMSDQIHIINSSLSDVILSNNIQIIANDAFYGCSSLKSINIDTPNVVTIGKYSFPNDTIIHLPLRLKELYLNTSPYIEMQDRLIFDL